MNITIYTNRENLVLTHGGPMRVTQCIVYVGTKIMHVFESKHSLMYRGQTDARRWAQRYATKLSQKTGMPVVNAYHKCRNCYLHAAPFVR